MTYLTPILFLTILFLGGSNGYLLYSLLLFYILFTLIYIFLYSRERYEDTIDLLEGLDMTGNINIVVAISLLILSAMVYTNNKDYGVQLMTGIIFLLLGILTKIVSNRLMIMEITDTVDLTYREKSKR